MHWYVQVQNQAYGPYSEEQMQSFVSEGRINENSLITNAPDSGYFHAVAYDVFKLWSGTGQSMAVGAEVQSYQQMSPYTQPYKAPKTQQHIVPEPVIVAAQASPTASTAPTNVFLVMAEIQSEGAMGFLKALQSFGTAQRIGDTVWLLRSASGVEQLRNALSQSLDRQDRLFILDSSANKTAWFNIGADLDNRIRELWDEEED